MLSRLKQFLTGAQDAPATPDAMDYSMAVGVLLLEAARSDGDFSRQEREFVFDILHHRFELDPADADRLLNEAETAVDAELDLFPFTRRINESLSRNQKVHLLEEVWEVILADGRLDPQEDYMIHKFQRLLNLSHQELIEAKLLARQRLGGQ